MEYKFCPCSEKIGFNKSIIYLACVQVFRQTNTHSYKTEMSTIRVSGLEIWTV